MVVYSERPTSMYSQLQVVLHSTARKPCCYGLMDDRPHYPADDQSKDPIDLLKSFACLRSGVVLMLGSLITLQSELKVRIAASAATFALILTHLRCCTGHGARGGGLGWGGRAAAAVPQSGEQCGRGAAPAGHQPGIPARHPGGLHPHDSGAIRSVMCTTVSSGRQAG